MLCKRTKFYSAYCSHLLLHAILIMFTISGSYGQGLEKAGREISGIIKDSTNAPIYGATIVLKYSMDSIQISTNAKGVFVFKNVKAGEFVLSVRSLGYRTFNKRYLFNEGVSKIVLDPIILTNSVTLLNTVTINGTPSIIYKQDTVEYRAADYIVKPHASVADLLKKMEGVDVGADGKVTHQGVLVESLRLNGKNYGGDDIVPAIKNLPAEIIEKVQFIDDFGKEASRTGIKDNNPTKVVNVTTKRDRSIGNTGRLVASAGNEDRYDFSIGGIRLNLNQRLDAQVYLNNTITGIAGPSFEIARSSGSLSNLPGGGVSKIGGGNVGFQEQLGKKISVNANYAYSFNDNRAINKDRSERYSAIENNLGAIEDVTTFLTSATSRKQKSRINTFKFELDYEIDSLNFLNFSPTVSYNQIIHTSFLTEVKTGFQNRTDITDNNKEGSTPTFGGKLLYQHRFVKKGRNTSLSFNYERNEDKGLTGLNALIKQFGQNNTILPDSIVRRIILNRNLKNTRAASLTFTEPLSSGENASSKLQFTINVSSKKYYNTRITDNHISGQPVKIDSLSNNFDYDFITANYGVGYNVKRKNYSATIGLSLVTSMLGSAKEVRNQLSTNTQFLIIPNIDFDYKFSRTQSFAIRYSGYYEEPLYYQIQPIRDETDPNNPVIGNPFLKIPFKHNLSVKYNNYLPNIKLNLYANLTGSNIRKKVTPNIIEYKNSGTLSNVILREMRYINLDGSHSLDGNYGISKALNDRKYKFDLNGSFKYNKVVSMSNDNLNYGNMLGFSERVGLQWSPGSGIELNPNLSYSTIKSSYTFSGKNNHTKAFTLSGDGQSYFLKKYVLAFSASKNFISGINSNITTNPFVINASIERELFKRGNGTIGIQVFDVLNQNNFIIRSINENGFTDTRSNVLSRYFLINLKWAPQRWTGVPIKNGKPIKRRGDGSFIR